MIRRAIGRLLDHPLVVLICETDVSELLRRLCPFVLRSTYERDIAGLQQALEEERSRSAALASWLPEPPPAVFRFNRKRI